MRTTLDLPDSLMKRTKIAAVQRGQTLKDFLTRLIERGLEFESVEELSNAKRTLPEILPSRGGRIPNLTGSEIDDILDRG